MSFIFSFTVNGANCVLMAVYKFTSYVVTAVCQLLINGYVMLCYVMLLVSTPSKMSVHVHIWVILLRLC